MKKILQLVLSLTIISAVCAGLLAVVNSVTEAPIRNIAVLKANKAARAVLPPGVKAIDTREDPADKSLTIFIGYADDAKTQIAGYAVPGLSANGYGGDIRLTVGLTPDRKVVSYQVLAANETPGLGAKLSTPEFAGQFAGKPAASLKVKKDGGDVDAITGATITSRAVCGAIADANARLDRLEGKAGAESAKPAPNKGTMIQDPSRNDIALRALPKGTATATALPNTGTYPAFVGKDAAGAVTGYTVTGTGTGKGPGGEVLLHVLFGFDARGQLSRTASPIYLNRPDGNPQDMIRAQNTAFNAAMADAMTKMAAIRKTIAK